jgi:ankyrin repeat protein
MSCYRCHHQHTTKSCVKKASIKGTKVKDLDTDDVFMFGPVDIRIILLLPTEVWQLLLSYLAVNDLIPAVPLTNKYLNEQVVWNPCSSGPLLWGEMAQKGIDQNQDSVGINAKAFKTCETGQHHPKWSALMRICSLSNRPDAQARQVAILVKGGANVNTADHAGYTPLHFVREQSVSCLIASKADVNASSFHGWTPLMIASGEKNSENVENVSLVLTLIEHRANIDKENRFCGTALMVASYNNHVEIVRTLLGYGADTRTVDVGGKNALDRARENGYHEIVELLENHQA